MTALRGYVLGLAVLFAPMSVSAQIPEERDWGETLRIDAQALHDDIAANHPGQVDIENPGFAVNNAEQLALALERAETADSYGDYYYAMRIYAASFNDGHMFIGARGSTPNNFQWPGFATDYDDDGDIRVTLASEDTIVPVGARLIGCDGLSAEEYAAATLGTMFGRWELESQRRQLGASLFFDESSGYIPTAKRCTFEHSGMSWDIALDWQPISTKQYFEYRAGRRTNARLEFGYDMLPTGLHWFSMPSFNGEPTSKAAKELGDMIERMKQDRAVLSSSNGVVLDLRGNGGGSSDWSFQMAKVLWGEVAIAAIPDRNHHAEWRASPVNLKRMKQAYERRSAGGPLTQEVDAYFRAAIEGIEAALENGDELWREPSYDLSRTATLDASSAIEPVAAPIYVLTDRRCMSACLDAVDLWLELGAVHVGKTTSADTNYLEVRRYTLPSGLVGGMLPMKVHRNRARGSNEAVIPVHTYTGDIAETVAVQAWVADLAMSNKPAD